jgi:hypothetical protein
MVGGLMGNPLPWLLSLDDANPGVRFFALRDLQGLPMDSPEVSEAQSHVMSTGPVPAILDAQFPEGYWGKSGAGYSPKYRGTAWQVLFLAQLGASGQDDRVRRAVEYVLSHHLTVNGALSFNGRPSGKVHCLWGNLVRAMLELGYDNDERVQNSVEQLSRSITGEGYDHYLRSGLREPGFVCSANYGFPCAWGAVRALWALNRVPTEWQSPPVQEAIAATTEFLLSYDIAAANYPYKDRINSSWFKFGYPLGYVTDVLLNLEALVEAGFSADDRLRGAIDLVLGKQDEQGRWTLEYSYNGKTWVDIEEKGQPSKWVTLRALRVISQVPEG